MESFIYDNDNMSITMIFSETVDIESFQVSEVTLQDFFIAAFSYSLTNGRVVQPHATALTLFLSVEDSNTLKRNENLVNARADTWMTFPKTLVADMALVPNKVVEIADNAAIFDAMAATRFEYDKTAPELAYFILDMSNRTLLLGFTEPVRDLSARPRHVLLTGVSDGSEAHPIRLSTSIVLETENLPEIMFSLSEADFNAIAIRDDVGIQVNNTYVSIEPGLVLDMSRNLVKGLALEEAVMAASVVLDSHPPTLRSFEINMDSQLLVLTFSEVVRKNTLQIGEFTLMGASGVASYTLTSSSTLTDWAVRRTLNSSIVLDNSLVEINAAVVSLSIGQQDADEIKRLTSLAVSLASTRLTITTAGIQDMAGNGVAVSQPQAAVGWYPDLTKPKLLDAKLNLSSGVLRLSFSETMSSQTFSASPVVLSNGYPRLHVLNEHVELTTSATLTPDAAIIHVQLSVEDLNEVKRHRSLGLNMQSIAIYYLSSFISDMAGNAIQTREDVHRLTFSEVVRDEVSPSVVSFTVNMDSSYLSISFDEVVKFSSWNSSAIRLNDGLGSELVLSQSVAQATAPFTGPLQNTPSLVDARNQTLTDERDLSVVHIVLHVDERDSIAASATLCRTTSTCNLVLEAPAVVDLADNSAQAVDMLPAENLVADLQRAQLLAYDLDLVTGQLTLRFDEPMNSSAFLPVGLTIQNAATLPTESHTLSGGSVSGSSKLRVLTITLLEADVVAIQTNRGLAADGNTTFLSLLSSTFVDNSESRNTVLPLLSTNAMAATVWRYYSPSTFSLINPSVGSINGGYKASILGSGFEQSSLTAVSPYIATLSVGVLFGNTPATNVQVINDTQIEFTVPAHSQGTVNVTLTLNNAIDTWVPAGFTFLPVPVVNSFAPIAVSATGGTSITVSGHNFGPPTSATSPLVEVRLGDTPCSSTTVINATTMVCVTASLPSDVDYALTVTVTSATTPANPSLVVKTLPTPVLDRISPSQGYSQEPTAIELFGNHFGPSSASFLGPQVTVDIGNRTCQSITVVNMTYATCLVPPSTGIHNVSVTVDGQTSVDAVTFVDYDDAGRFDLSVATLAVSELQQWVAINVTRTGSSLGSPAIVNMSIEEGTATSPAYFLAEDLVLAFPSGATYQTVNVSITAGSRIQAVPRSGQADDRTAIIRIVNALSEEGTASIGVDASTLTIEAICEVVSFECNALWSRDGVEFSRAI
jgi:hypothetical protein